MQKYVKLYYLYNVRREAKVVDIIMNLNKGQLAGTIDWVYMLRSRKLLLVSDII